MNGDGCSIIAIGASAGGVEATRKVLMKLPESMPPILITQHLPPQVPQLFVQAFDSSCCLHIVEAQDYMEAQPGNAYIAPGDQHMEVFSLGAKFFIKLKAGTKINGHMPSVDVLFDSVARNAGESAVGVLLTGMGEDGAKGLLHMKNRGAFTIGQDERSSMVYGMPKAAYDMGAVCVQADIDDIHELLIRKSGVAH